MGFSGRRSSQGVGRQLRRPVLQQRGGTACLERVQEMATAIAELREQTEGAVSLRCELRDLNKNGATRVTAAVMAVLAILLMAGPAGAADVAWTSDGVGVRSQPGTANHAVNPEIVADASGGAIITWPDFRSATQWNIYAQRVDASGRRMWKTDGVGVRSQPGTPDNAFNSRITTDGAGGAIIGWQDYRSGNKWDIYSQRVDSQGHTRWTADGVGLRNRASSKGDATNQRMSSDGAGGAIVAWQDYRSQGSYDVYAQRVDSTGKLLWGTEGNACLLYTSPSPRDGLLS